MIEPVGWVSGVIIGLAAVYKALPSCWAFVKAAARVPLTIERVYAEFQPNGGHSMRDRLNAVESKVDAIGDRVQVLEDRP